MLPSLPLLCPSLCRPDGCVDLRRTAGARAAQGVGLVRDGAHSARTTFFHELLSASERLLEGAALPKSSSKRSHQLWTCRTPRPRRTQWAGRRRRSAGSAPRSCGSSCCASTAGGGRARGTSCPCATHRSSCARRVPCFCRSLRLVLALRCLLRPAKHLRFVLLRRRGR